MASNKFVIKCGNFAVLVDVHILPQGSSKDTSWFSDHEKEEVCMMLEEVVASRVKHYLEASKQRGQWKSMERASSGPLFLTGMILQLLYNGFIYDLGPCPADLCELEACVPMSVTTEPYSSLNMCYTDARNCETRSCEIRVLPYNTTFLTNGFHITAYFMKRWVNLRCAVGKHYRDLRVFPERFIVCVSKLGLDSSAWTCENGVLKEELSNGTSEYFTESAEDKKPKISPSEQIKQDVLKEIVKRTKLRKTSASKPQISKESKIECFGSVDLQMENKKSDCQPSLSPQPEVKRRSTGLLKDCINTAESNMELPVLELENYVNQSQPDDVSSQQKPHSLEQLKRSLLSENPPCSSESALLDPKQSQTATKTQAPQKSWGSGEKLEHCKKASSEGALSIPGHAERSKCTAGPFLEEKTPLNSRLFLKQGMTEAVSEEESLTLRKTLSRPLAERNGLVQRSQNGPSSTPEELPVVPSSCSELQPLSSEQLTQKRKKEGENGLRKLKLRRLKKS